MEKPSLTGGTTTDDTISERGKQPDLKERVAAQYGKPDGAFQYDGSQKPERPVIIAREKKIRRIGSSKRYHLSSRCGQWR